jgi:hypothetical protein
MHKPTEVVPFVHASKLDSIANTQGHTLRQIDIVRQQQTLAVTQVQHNSLMAVAIVVVSQKPPHYACLFNPGTTI